ncbi:hypothetical protein Ancab_026128 [Ancistrocladus abbreviatus]
MIKLYGKPIRVNKASQDKKSLDVGANLFVGNLDPDVDENYFMILSVLLESLLRIRRFQILWFLNLGVGIQSYSILRDPETGNSRGFGFISYDSFEASDAAIEVSFDIYSLDLDWKTAIEKERVLAASNPNAQKSRPRSLFASIPQANGAVAGPVPPRPFVNGVVQPSTMPPVQPSPPPSGVFPPIPMAGPPSMPPPPLQFGPIPPNMSPPPPQGAPALSGPPPPPTVITGPPPGW